MNDIEKIGLGMDTIFFIGFMICIIMSFFDSGFYTTFAIILIYAELKATKYNDKKRG